MSEAPEYRDVSSFAPGEDDEFGLREYPRTPALDRLLTSAEIIYDRYYESADYRGSTGVFKALLASFLVSDDPISDWFQEYVEDADVAVGGILAPLGPELSQLRDVMTRPPPEQDDRQAQWRQEPAAQALLRAAGALLEVSNPDDQRPVLDVRHLMGACIYLPPPASDFRDRWASDLQSWGFDRLRWSNAFFSQVAEWYPAERDAWREFGREYLGAEPDLASGPRPDVGEGPSTHIATDRWTLDDKLGYRAYAYAIARFITHPQTTYPLVISVEAPWGGGKTSLMRMIQQELDPGALRAAEASREAGAETSAEEEAGRAAPSHTVSVRKLLTEAQNLAGEAKRAEFSPQVSEDTLTIWFNAWKYQSTNQVWAGLADAIIRQVASRLPPAEQLRFWVRLNLRRMDVEKIRRQVAEKVFLSFWSKARPWLWGIAGVVLVFALTVLLGLVLRTAWIQSVGWTGTLSSVLLAAIKSVIGYVSAKKDVEGEPATVDLGEYLDVPDYRSELGFIHQVEADLRRVLNSVPTRPLVVFVDDLDRCSPDAVADVVEAINLFLAGDFPDCAFVLGMDAEMVAAAMQAAHASVTAYLPDDATVPVGWRFMHKFVQLPFIIPPVSEPKLKGYTEALLSADRKLPPLAPRVLESAQEAIRRMKRIEDVNLEMDGLRQRYDLSQEQRLFLQEVLGQQVTTRATIDDGIESFTDEDSEVRRLILAAASDFSHNPRELKRFVNAFRLQYFLWWARRAQGQGVPSLDQLKRWVLFSMRWPQVVRCLRRGSPSRLQKLEDAGGKSPDLDRWQEQVSKILRLKPEKTPWLKDDELRQFFQDESTLPAGQRLSDARDLGLW